MVGTQVILVRADATSLPFKGALNPKIELDRVFTAQSFHHIPNFYIACKEGYRFFKVSGLFVNYSFSINSLIKFIYQCLGKDYQINCLAKNRFHLARANNAQCRIISEIFGGDVTGRYTECLLHPDFKLTFSVHTSSWVSRLDVLLPQLVISKLMSRQHSFEVNKL